MLNTDALAGSTSSAFPLLGLAGKHHLDWALRFTQSRIGERACRAIHPTTQILRPLEGRGGDDTNSPLFSLGHGSELCFPPPEELPGRQGI